MLDRAAVKHMYAGHIEPGKSAWKKFHVTDVACGYLALLQ